VADDGLANFAGPGIKMHAEARMLTRPYIALFAIAVTLLAGAARASDLSDASPADLEAVIAQIPAKGAPAEAALRRAEAMFRLGDLRGDVPMIRQGADAAGAVLSSLETGSRGALWVIANKDVGTALVMLARRSNDRARLDEAIAAFESAALFARDSLPEEWPGLMNSLAIAEWTKGSMAKDVDAMRKAADTFRAALDDKSVTLSDREKVRIQVNMASALVEMSTVSNDPAPANEAVTRLQGALAMVGPLNLPAQKAIIQGNLAQALAVRGWNNRTTDDLEQSVALGKEAVAYWDSVGATDARNEAEANLRQAYQLLAELYSAR
jgi:tetratricopeptide (TPR) repeat protein